MKTFLQAHGLWEVVEGSKKPYVLPENPTIMQLEYHAEESARTFKALSIIQNSVSEVIFNRIITCSTPKDAWDMLKANFEGSKKVRALQLRNLRREFEYLRTKEGESVRQYADRIMSIIYKMRLLGADDDISQSRIVLKLTDTLPEKYEAKLCSLEESWDLSTVSLFEAVNALQAFEQRQGSNFLLKVLFKQKVRKRLKAVEKQRRMLVGKERRKEGYSDYDAEKKQKDLCKHCKRPNHPEKECWFRPDAICSICNKKGHVGKVCESKQQ